MESDKTEEGFICREWVFCRLAKCLRYSAGSVSGVLLVGGPGTGKTAICNQLVSPSCPGLQQSLHERLLFSHFVSPRRTPDAQLADIASSLSNSLKRFLGEEVDGDGGDPVLLCERLLARMKSGSNPDKCSFLLVDGLHRDESGLVAQFLSGIRKYLPPWLLLVISTRRHSNTIKLFRGFRKIVLDDTNKSVVLDDLQQYVIARVQQDHSLSELVHKIDLNFLRKLQIKSNGSVLYIDKVLSCLSSGFLSIESIDSIPVTLFGLYLWICQKAFTRKHFHKARPVLNILIASTLPLPEHMLFQCMCLKNAAVVRQDFERRLHVLKLFITLQRVCGGIRGGAEEEEEVEGWSLFHDSCKQWLTEVKYCTSSYLCDSREGDRVLACCMLRKAGELSSNEVDNLMIHLTEMYTPKTITRPIISDSSEDTSSDTYHLLLILLWSGVGADLHFSPKTDAGVSCQLLLLEKNVGERKILAEHIIAEDQFHSPESTKCNNEKSEATADTLDDFNSGEWQFESESVDLLKENETTPEFSAENIVRVCDRSSCSSVEGSISSVEGSLEGGVHEPASDGDALKCLLGVEDEHSRTATSQSSSEHRADPSNNTGIKCDAGISREVHGENSAVEPIESHCTRMVENLDLTTAASGATNNEPLNDSICCVDSIEPKDTAENTESNAALLRSGDDSRDTDEPYDVMSAVVAGNLQLVRALVQAGAAVEVEDERGRSAVTLAVMSPVAAVDILKVLLDAGADANHRDRVGVTPLLIAAFEGNTDVCELLLRCGADTDHKDSLGRCALFAAASMGHTAVIKLLARWGCYLNIIDSQGRTALSLAASHGSVASVSALLDCGLDEMHRDNSGSTPLHHAASEGRRQVVETLLRFGASANEVDNKGRHPLLLAATQRHLSTASLLLAFDADPNLCGHDGKSALYVALFSEQVGLVEMLVASGADVSPRDREGRSLLYWLVLHCRLQMAVMLIALGCDLEASDRQGRTALHVSCWQGNEPIVLKLLGSGADPNAEDGDGCTPIISAAWQGHVRVISMLVMHGASVDHACAQGATALCIAAQEGYLQCVGLLLEHGADPNHQDATGRSAVKVALKGGHHRVVCVLQRFGALVTAEDAAALSSLQEGQSMCRHDNKALHSLAAHPAYSNTKHCQNTKFHDQRVK